MEGPSAAICWAAVREWLIAFGTISATGAAVYIGVIRERYQRPRLSLSFDWGRTDDAQLVGLATGQRAAYARLRIGNAPKKRMAERVEVRVQQVVIVEPKPAGKIQPIQLADSALAVSLSSPTTSELDVAPGSERHVDFVHVEEGIRGLIFDVWPVPVDKRHILDTGQVEVTLSLAAANADAQSFQVNVSWDGQFRARSWEEIWQHLRVGSPTKI